MVKVFLRDVCFIPNELRNYCKTRIILESNMRGRVDVLRPSETHLFGQRVSESGSVSGLKGGAVWTGIDECHSERGKEELWLTAAAQQDEKVLHHISLAQERLKIQNLKCSLY